MKIVTSGKVSRGRARAAALFYGFAVLTALLATLQEPHAQDKSFLWKVQSDKNIIYILGSIHYLKKENFPLKKTIENVFSGAKKVVLEIDLKTATPEKVQQITLEKGLYRDGTTLQQNIDPETYTLVARRAKELGVEPRAMTSLKPWLVAMTLTSLKLQKLGFDSSYGVDRYLAERAKTSGKMTGGLETLEFQIGLLDQLSPRDQEAMLRQGLKDLDLLDQSVAPVVQSWIRGDVDSLEELLLGGMREYPELYQKLIVERNRRWLPQIEKLVGQNENVLLVVGAAHLVGKDGVIESLKARGYAVEQM
jgi:uncharacterized protein YbaP (TraB family)